MRRVLAYSGLLVLGMIVAQAFNLQRFHPAISFITMVCLSAIMIDVGLEFVIDKKKLGVYGWDFAVAMTAASFPWIFCAAYFVWVLGVSWKAALLVGCFAAPTSAGILFTLLGAAGLGTTWLYKKARVLAIFDDLGTVLLLIPLQILFIGFQKELIFVLAIIVGLLGVGYRWLHRVQAPTSPVWVLVYGIAIAAIEWTLERFAHMSVGVLLPAFITGCLLYSGSHATDKNPEQIGKVWLDPSIKALFMFLIGCSLPRISSSTLGIMAILSHVLALTILSNIGKCFPLLCYRREVSAKQRLALSIAMFPRGEVGAGVLLIALGYGLDGPAVSLGALSLALNLLLTSGFIYAVIKILSSDSEKRTNRLSV